MTQPRPLVLTASVAFLFLVGVVADWYSVDHRLPYGVGGHGQPSRVGQDWPSHGTALGPPLLPFIVLVVGVVLALVTRRRWGAIGDGLLLLVAAAELWGTLAEPSFRHVFTSGGFDLVQVLVRIATLAAVAALAVAAVADVRARFRHR